jgi:formate hydrogenlyase subunit 6/NADH:ubiquinone oxidoreductase subunit I
MNIFNLLSQNLGQGSRTRLPEDAVPYPSGYRGRINHDLSICTACGTCVYACSPKAITIDESSADVSVWQYTEDRCTFCGFCVEYCPTQALSFDPVAPAPLTERPQHYLSHAIPLQPCRECGEPVRSIPEVILIRLYGDPLPEEIAAAQGLCERCRQRVVGDRFMRVLAGKRGNDGD